MAVKNQQNFYQGIFYGAIFGYCMPYIFNLESTNRILTESMYNRYITAYNMIIDNLNLRDGYTDEGISYSKRNYEVNPILIQDNELEDYIINFDQTHSR